MSTAEHRKISKAKWQKLNPERSRIATNKWRKANPDKVKAQIKAWKQANYEKYRESQRRSRWKRLCGLSQEEVEVLGNSCQICGDTKRLNIDHDHINGKVRGLLCNRCNTSLERLESVEDWCNLAQNYLKRSAWPK